MPHARERFYYKAFGWHIASEIELPLLSSAAASPSGPDIQITIGPVEPLVIFRKLYRQHHIYEELRYIVADGREIAIEPLAGSKPANVASLIVSRLLTIAAYQRGQLPLHASAVRLGGRLVAICGYSGSGKSTLAALLIERGGQLYEDDMVVVEGHGPFFASGPSASGMKLSEASLHQIGRTADGLALANHVEGKYFAPVRPAELSRAEIGAIIQLGPGRPGIHPATPEEALGRWQACIRQPDLLSEAPDRASLWRTWLDLAAQTEFLSICHDGQMHVSAAAADQIAQRFSK
ncbi:hypothetical protein AB5I39_12010 [Sphingomonas sp. MMS24-J45]|uniref:hypothetical protein n=1 Tax=Sphingomonas sp. MMS24-J45 TaxID=3238806 RepID=UPI003850291C